MAFAVGILVGLLTLFMIFWYWRGGLRKLSKRAILIVGPSDAGKTVLFSQLVHQKVCNGQTYISEILELVLPIPFS